MRRRFRLLAIISLLALVSPAYAQQPAQPPAQPEHVLLWKASSPTATAYLIGSIHVGDLKGNEPCFVVVGALHLLGDKGIVKLLQSKGYHVELVGGAQ